MEGFATLSAAEVLVVELRLVDRPDIVYLMACAVVRPVAAPIPLISCENF